MAISDELTRSRPALIEIRSIDYIPESERHGGLASQFTLWLGANLQITARNHARACGVQANV